MSDKEQLTEYAKYLSALAKGNVDRIFLNSDENHAIEVFKTMFENAQEEVCIFAGNLCDEIGSNSGYIETLSDFIDRGGKLRLLLNKYTSELAIKSSLFKRLAYHITEGADIKVKSTNVKPHIKNDPDNNEVHFAVADGKAYRLETDISNKSAAGNFNKPDFAGSIKEYFYNLFNDQAHSNEVNILSLFDGTK